MKFGSLRVTLADGRTREYDIDLPSLTIGRAVGSSIVIDDASLSARHARVFVDSSRLLVEDLESESGTFVDTEPVRPRSPALVKDGSDIRLGNVVFRYFAPPPMVSEAAAVAMEAPELARPEQHEDGTGHELLPDIVVALSVPPVAIEPGNAPAIAQLSVRNKGRVVDELSITIRDLPPEWVRVSQTKVILLPGDQAEISIIVMPPRRPDSRAGEYPFAVSVVSTESAREVVANGVLTVSGYEGTELSLRPIRSRKKFTLTAVNRGNGLATYALAGKDDEEAFVYHFDQPALDLQPGEERELHFTVAPRKRKLFGRPQVQPFRVVAAATDGPGRVVADGQLNIVRPLEKFKVPGILTLLVILGFGSLLFYWRWPSTPLAAINEVKSIVSSVKNRVSQKDAAEAASDPEALYHGVHMCSKGDKKKVQAVGTNEAPYFSQSDPLWAKREYAQSSDTNHPSGYCGETLEQCGCAITSVASILASFGVLAMPTDNAPLTPETVNAWFDNNAKELGRGWVSDGYVFGDIVWTGVNELSAAIARQNGGKTPVIRFAGYGTGSEEEVRAELEAKRFVILELPGHYVTATGFDIERRIVINDPYYRDRRLMSDYEGLITGSVMFERVTPDTTAASVVITAPSDVRIKVTDAEGRVVGTLRGGPPEAVAAEAQRGITGAVYRFKRAWRDPSCVASPPPPDAGTTQITLPGNLANYTIEAVPTKTDGSIAIHTYDLAGNVTVFGDNFRGPYLLSMKYDPTKQSPDIQVNRGSSGPADGGDGATASPGAKTPGAAGSPGAVAGGGATGATGTGGAAAGGTPGASRTPSPGAGGGAGTGSATTGPTATAPPTATPTPPKPPTNVTLVCTPTYSVDPRQATINCSVAVDGAAQTLKWTVNGIPVVAAANKTTMAVSFGADLLVNVALDACNGIACKSATSAVRVQFPAPGATPTATPLAGTPTPTPPPAVTNARAVCSVTYEPYALKTAHIHCEATFFGTFTHILWDAPGATPPNADTGTRTHDMTLPFGPGAAPTDIIVTVRVCNETTCVTLDPATATVQHLEGVPLVLTKVCGGTSTIALDAADPGSRQWFVNGAATDSATNQVAVSTPNGATTQVDVLYGGSQVRLSRIQVVCP